MERWVLLHGAPLSPEGWDSVRPLLPGDVVAPDLNHLITADRSDRLLQTDLAASVLANIDGDELMVVGHSLGGQVAMEMAMLASHRVRCLILVCTRDIPVPEFHRAAADLRRGVPLDVHATIERWFTRAEVAAHGPVVQYARKRLQTASPQVYSSALDALARYDRRADLKAIGTPGVVIGGRLDQGCTADVVATLARDLPHSRLHIVDGWAHMSPFVHAEQFGRMIVAASEAALRP